MGVRLAKPRSMLSRKAPTTSHCRNKALACGRLIAGDSDWETVTLCGRGKRKGGRTPRGMFERPGPPVKEPYVNGMQRLSADPSKFNPTGLLPYELRLDDFRMAIQDVYDLLFDINSALVGRGLPRMEEIVRPAIFSGILSDVLTTSLARHSRVLAENRFHNGHPDLIPTGRYPNDTIRAGEEGVEVKATRGAGAVDMHGARPAWLCVFRYTADSVTEPVVDRAPTRVVEVLLARLELDDFRRNPRGELGTRTASPNERGLAKLRENWMYRE